MADTTPVASPPVVGTSSGWSPPGSSATFGELDEHELRSLGEAGCSTARDLAGFTLGELDELVRGHSLARFGGAEVECPGRS